MSRKKYGFGVKPGGFTSYDGVITSSKKIKSAVRNLSDSGKGMVTITYNDGSIYKFECSRTETSSQITLTDIKETWNGKEIEAK